MQKMNFIRCISFMLILMISVSGCQKIYFGDDPKNSPVDNFEIFWKNFDMYYAQFKLRHIDWDSAYHIYRPQVNSNTSDFNLYKTLSSLVYLLNDMHVTLITPYGTASWKGWDHGVYPSSKIIHPCKYIICGSPQTSVFEYRDFRNLNIGYLVIPTFVGSGNGENYSDPRYLDIDNILEQFKYKDGLIIDVRWNPGGNSSNANLVASRFADKKRLYSKYYTKNGIGKDDFSDWINLYVEPKGPAQFTKPVIVLTSRQTSSSAEDFVMAMKVLPQVTVIGDTTGGGVGNPIYRELPNGWAYRLSTKIAATADNYIVEGRGLPPDITVLTTQTDSIQGNDRILEKGIELILKQ
jgi:carboxyl-terminal processing protease